MHYVFLDPDGTSPVKLAVIVHATTGVTYANQCDGYATEVRGVEGFLVPLGSRDESGFDPEAALNAFFWAEFRGHAYMREAWTDELIARLADLISRVCMWWTVPEGPNAPQYLALDMDRIDDATEAWVPVITPYGPGTLVFQNCD